MPLTWSEIVVSLEELGATSPEVRPGLYGRIMQRLLAADEPQQEPSRAALHDPDESDASPPAQGRLPDPEPAESRCADTA